MCVYKCDFLKVKMAAVEKRKKFLGELPRRKSNLAVDVNTIDTLEQYQRVEDRLKSMPNET